MLRESWKELTEAVRPSRTMLGQKTLGAGLRKHTTAQFTELEGHKLGGKK